MNIFIKLSNFLRDLRSAYSYPLDHLRIMLMKRSFRPGDRYKIFAQVAEDYTYFHRLSLLLEHLGQADISWLVVRGDRYQRKGLRSHLLRSLLTNPLTDSKFTFLFKSCFGGKIVYRNYSSSFDTNKVSNLAEELISKAQDVDSLLALRIGNVNIGDLIYDTYLRFKPAPTLDVCDPYLKDLLYYAAKTYLGIEQVLKNNHFDYFISTYSSYVDHGIAVRLCLQGKINVICTGSFNQVLVSPTVDFPYHKRNFHKYKEWITDSIRPQVQTLGKVIMQKRFSGEVDNVTGYMKKSSFDPTSTELIRPEQKKCLVMAHDFFDSPHVYGSMLFPDYYSWLEFILVSATECETHHYYVKPHPNAVKDSEFFYRELACRFPSVTFLEPVISNNSLLKSSFTCIFTLNGTVAHEFPYGGIPAVTAGDNPHTKFRFAYQARSREELRELIINPENVSVQIDKGEIELFAGIHSWRIYSENLGQTFPWIKNSSHLLSILSSEELYHHCLEVIGRELKNLHSM
jgi:hypothetical protein